MVLSVLAITAALFVAQVKSGRSNSRRLTYNSFFGDSFGSNSGDTYNYNSFFGSSFGSQSERDTKDGIYRGGSSTPSYSSSSYYKPTSDSSSSSSGVDYSHMASSAGDVILGLFLMICLPLIVFSGIAYCCYKHFKSKRASESEAAVVVNDENNAKSNDLTAHPIVNAPDQTMAPPPQMMVQPPMAAYGQPVMDVNGQPMMVPTP